MGYLPLENPKWAGKVMVTQMNNDLKIYRAAVAVTSVITLIGAAMLAIFELAFYDTGTNLFSRGAPSWIIMLFAAVGILFSVISSLLIRAENFPLTYPEKSSKFTGFAELLCAGVLILTFAVQFIRLGNTTDHLTELWLTSGNTLSAAVRMLRISVFLALASSIYFIFSFITQKSSTALAIVFCLWVFAYLLRIYYDMSLLIVDPVRKLTIAALCSILLFMCAEIRMIVGKPSPRLFVCFGFLALFFCGASGISKLIITFTGFDGFTTQSVYDCFEVAFALYVLSRLLAFVSEEAYDNSVKFAVSETSEPKEPTSSAGSDTAPDTAAVTEINTNNDAGTVDDAPENNDDKSEESK